MVAGKKSDKMDEKKGDVKPAKKVRIALVGATGYAGCEAIRWLLRHPHVQITGLYGPENELGPIDKFFPMLTGQLPLSQELFDVDKVARTADLAMLCVPHKVAMAYVPKLRQAGLRVIDWSADYRLKDPANYEKWYCPHVDLPGLAEAVYGLPEYFAADIAKAGLIANPGCYPTCTTLALAPLLKEGLIADEGIIVSAVSGVSGAGRTPSQKCHYPDRNENFEPYSVGVHRHMPEMEQAAGTIAGRKISLMFVPHLCPMDRGMLCSIYAAPGRSGLTAQMLNDALTAAYADAPFVRVRTDVLPATKYVAFTNYCDVTARLEKGRVMLFSALDNLVKGASGQAIQNMNIMYGWDQRTGLI
jgi:N-acetyl-gamma-glutamyl-phosphate reductase